MPAFEFLVEHRETGKEVLLLWIYYGYYYGYITDVSWIYYGYYYGYISFITDIITDV